MNAAALADLYELSGAREDDIFDVFPSGVRQGYSRRAQLGARLEETQLDDGGA